MQHNLSISALVKLTFSALIFAAVILVSVILPAEYNIDPTGLGEKLGLLVLATSPESPKVAALIETGETSQTGQALDNIEVVVPAGRGVEFKFSMQQFQKMEYEWLTDGQALYFDLHGEPAGDTSGYFESYAIATLSEMKGSFSAPFTGAHGWYWNNKTDKSVTVQLKVKGEYNIIGLKQ